MIATLTLNPAIDKSARVSQLNIGDLNRMQEVKMTIGGKGINVAKAVRALKGKTEVFTITAGATGKLVEDYLRDNYFAAHIVKAEGNTRTNIKITDDEGRLTEINDEGPHVSKEVLNLLLIKMLKSIKPDDTLVLSGSLPEGVPDTVYASIITQAKQKGIHTVLDADGVAFRYGAEAVPEIVKPNIHELRNYFGIEQQIDIKQAMEYARKLVDLGIGLVTVSMGHQGALFARKDVMYYSPAISVKTDSTVGAGDAMTGAIALALSQHMSDEDMIRLSMAAGAAACTSRVMSVLSVQPLMEQVEVQKL